MIHLEAPKRPWIGSDGEDLESVELFSCLLCSTGLAVELGTGTNCTLVEINRRPEGLIGGGSAFPRRHWKFQVNPCPFVQGIHRKTWPTVHKILSNHLILLIPWSKLEPSEPTNLRIER